MRRRSRYLIVAVGVIVTLQCALYISTALFSLTTAPPNYNDDIGEQYDSAMPNRRQFESTGLFFGDWARRLLIGRLRVTNANNKAATLAQAFRQCLAKTPSRNKVANTHQRDFNKFPVRIGSANLQKIEKIDCAVPCYHYPFAALQRRPVDNTTTTTTDDIYTFDASVVERLGPSGGQVSNDMLYLDFARLDPSLGLSVLRTMESAVYYPATDLAHARKHFDIVMTTRLDSDVPVPYFSWVLHDYMKPAREKTADALSSAFISNCQARNFRLEAAQLMQKLDPKIGDFFGVCFPGSGSSLVEGEEGRFGGSKEKTMGDYKFHLAFENSNDLDYVTEKFFQALVEGTVPVVIGAPNIGDFAPSNNSILVVEKMEDVERVVAAMHRLGEDDEAYEAMLEWKETGPSDQFKALVDLAVVHSSCRLCIHVADRLRKKEQQQSDANDQQCFCDARDIKVAENSSTTLAHFYVRERGLFDYFDAFISYELASQIRLASVFDAIRLAFSRSSPEGYWPMWTRERDETGRRPMLSGYYSSSAPPLKIHALYEVGATPRQALFGDANIDSNEKIVRLFLQRRCLHLEVVFV